jgi:von Willebrand factor type A domain
MVGSLVFLTPEGALLTVGALVPLAAVLLVRRRAQRVRRSLGLAEPRPSRLVLALGALLVAATCVGLAAAQPVLERTTTLRTRTDAEAFVVLDVSRSMLARSGTDSPSRLERAKDAARELRTSLADVPMGIVSLTDRVLPHLFPGVNHAVFEATIDRSVDIEQPPPRSNFPTTATRLEALANIQTHRYFSPDARKRLLVVLTDGETQPVDPSRTALLFRREPPIETVFVQFWDEDERVFTRGAPERQYRPDPAARSTLERLAEAVGGSAYGEGDGRARETARKLLGSGPTVTRAEQEQRTALAPYLATAGFVPLALLLWRRDR